MKSAFEKVPNMATISSQVSPSVLSYHLLQVLIWFAGAPAGRVVSVGGKGKEDPKFATQYLPRTRC